MLNPLVLARLLLVWSAFTDNNGMISLVWFKHLLFQRLEILFLQVGNSPSEDSIRNCCNVNTRRLNSNDGMTTILQEVVSIEHQHSCLIRLSHIGKDAVHHTNQHAVLERVSGILNDGNDVGAGLGHFDEITAGALRKFHGIDSSTRSNDHVTDVTDQCSSSSSNVKNLETWLDPDTTDSSQCGSSD